MASQLFNQMNQSNFSNIKQIMNIMKCTNNPNQLLEYIVNQNPNYANIMKEIKDNGGDARKLFYEKANKMGINPDDILNQLK